jgi:hypothetical protein
LRAWQAKSENIFSRCRQKEVDKLRPLARLSVLPVTARQTKPNQTKMKTYRYEILDSMESVVALADSLEDALYAAEKHGAKLIFDTMNGKCVSFEVTA